MRKEHLDRGKSYCLTNGFFFYKKKMKRTREKLEKI